MSILIKTVRVNGFRALENIEVDLEHTTVLTGMNNTGKTSFLKVLQIVFGNRMFINPDDFCITGHTVSDQIIIDVKIIPVDLDQKQTDIFDENWEIELGIDRIQIDTEGNSFVPIRTIVTLNENNGTYRTKQHILPEWYKFEQGGNYWHQQQNGIEKSFSIEEIPFFYTNTQRDIIEDIKLKTSYLGRVISKIEYPDVVVKKIEKKIKKLNEKTVSSSDILLNLKNTLKELNTALDTSSEGIEITPFTKKLRDLSKGLTIHYTDDKESFSMDYHGMGTRSWSSLLTLKALISSLHTYIVSIDKVLFPILAIEEPEAHLHPNAQKKLFSQLDSIHGQKIIATHSPYIAASANLSQIRGLHKKNGKITFGQIDVSTFSKEDLRKVEREVIHSRGEILFSKVLVFFEGETEEQALPIFAEMFFEEPLLELGIDFVGVGGSGKYLPFLKVAHSLNIPWYIFSDGEVKTISDIKKSLMKYYDFIGEEKEQIDLSNEENIIIIENENDFEADLIHYDYTDEIIETFNLAFDENYLENKITQKDGTSKGREKTSNICDQCNQSIYQDVLRDYQGDEGYKRGLLDCMHDNKTFLSPILAQTICDSEKELPPKIIELFQKINTNIFNQNT